MVKCSKRLAEIKEKSRMPDTTFITVTLGKKMNKKGGGEISQIFVHTENLKRTLDKFVESTISWQIKRSVWK